VCVTHTQVFIPAWLLFAYGLGRMVVRLVRMRSPNEQVCENTQRESARARACARERKKEGQRRMRSPNEQACIQTYKEEEKEEER